MWQGFIAGGISYRASFIGAEAKALPRAPPRAKSEKGARARRSSRFNFGKAGRLGDAGNEREHLKIISPLMPGRRRRRAGKRPY